MDSRRSKTTRKAALLGILAVLPGGKRFVTNTIKANHDFSEIPINLDLYQCMGKIASGHWSEVILFRARQPGYKDLALKVEYPKTPVPIEDLIERTNRYRNDYIFWRDAFKKEMPNLIPESDYLVIKSPRTKNPAVATIQTYAGDNGFDPLDPKNRSRVRTALQDPIFMDEFKTFKRITLELKSAGHPPELSGEGNLLVIPEGNSYTLRLVDTHGFSDADQGARQRVAEKIEYLKEL